jgi:preprotein translocase subunit SecE
MAIERQDSSVEEKTGLARAPLGWWGRTSEFLTEVRNEMKRVTWPTQREVYATTVVVILTASFFGLYLFGVDIVLSNAVQAIFNRLGAA